MEKIIFLIKYYNTTTYNYFQIYATNNRTIHHRLPRTPLPPSPQPPPPSPIIILHHHPPHQQQRPRKSRVAIEPHSRASNWRRWRRSSSAHTIRTRSFARSWPPRLISAKHVFRLASRTAQYFIKSRWGILFNLSHMLRVEETALLHADWMTLFIWVTT